MTDADLLREACLQAVGQAGLTAVGERFHRFDAVLGGRPHGAKGDEGGGTPDIVATQAGVTGVVLLAESHLAVHTWPEHGVVTLDVFVCNVLSDNSARAEQLLNQLIQGFEPERHLVQLVRRAVPAVIPAASST